MTSEPTDADRQRAREVALDISSSAFNPGAARNAFAEDIQPRIAAAIAAARTEARAQVLADCAARAREIAEMYDQSSDGRNTFILFAEWAEARAIKEPTHGK